MTQNRDVRCYNVLSKHIPREQTCSEVLSFLLSLIHHYTKLETCIPIQLGSSKINLLECVRSRVYKEYKSYLPNVCIYWVVIFRADCTIKHYIVSFKKIFRMSRILFVF